ncbi:zf-HC2 domain-containing protein [Candidatus Marinimicrobia bacterium MT.SAG.3]|nr:zf-HC2 domain-containing protein [Candidatus Marinimicrobia bacterium MT.SAG.3]
MDCNGYRENLTNYIDNELTTQKNKSMLEHEAICSDCSELKSEIKNILGSVKRMTKVNASEDFETRLYEKLNSHAENSLRDKIMELFESSPVGIKALAAGFAVLMILVSGGYFMYDGISIGNEDGMPALSSPRYIEKNEDNSLDVIEEEATIEDEKIDEEEDDETDLDNPSENEVINE